MNSTLCIYTNSQDGKNLGESTILKLVDNSHLGQYVKYPIDIVKFTKGMTPDPTDDNSLWNITYNPTDPQRLWWDSTRDDFHATYLYNDDKCEWTDLCPSNAPSEAPSSSPSEKPSSVPSSAPSTEPSSSPSEKPSSFPSVFPSEEPSNEPSTSSMPSNQPSIEPYECKEGIDDTSACLQTCTFELIDTSTDAPSELCATKAQGGDLCGPGLGCVELSPCIGVQRQRWCMKESGR